MNPPMNDVKPQLYSDLELEIVKMAERENDEREDLIRKYTQEDVDKARLEGYQDGLTDASEEAYDKGWAEGYDQGFKEGYGEAKAMRELFGEGE
jgi:flagellar biosynthesis/type III secretory pathway protein FliH